MTGTPHPQVEGAAGGEEGPEKVSLGDALCLCLLPTLVRSAPPWAPLPRFWGGSVSQCR